MRYKTFNIVAEIGEEDVYGDLPSLHYIEVHNVKITTTQPIRKPNTHEVTMREDHPMFNFDIWGDVIDFVIAPTNYDNFHQFMGSSEVNDNIVKYFPNVMRYYRDQI
jgi:hypothetical protein